MKREALKIAPAEGSSAVFEGPLVFREPETDLETPGERAEAWLADCLRESRVAAEYKDPVGGWARGMLGNWWSSRYDGAWTHGGHSLCLPPFCAEKACVEAA
jgi:hypothetical protein